MLAFALGALGVHMADNGDGTYSNPLLPNAHWSDPSAVRVGATYFVVTSSIETTPSIQVLQSTDLVNWALVGSVSRSWIQRDPTTNATIPPAQCWSPRISYLRGKLHEHQLTAAINSLTHSSFTQVSFAFFGTRLAITSSSPRRRPPLGRGRSYGTT